MNVYLGCSLGNNFWMFCKLRGIDRVEEEFHTGLWGCSTGGFQRCQPLSCTERKHVYTVTSPIAGSQNTQYWPLNLCLHIRFTHFDMQHIIALHRPWQGDHSHRRWRVPVAGRSGHGSGPQAAGPAGTCWAALASWGQPLGSLWLTNCFISNFTSLICIKCKRKDIKSNCRSRIKICEGLSWIPVPLRWMASLISSRGFFKASQSRGHF